MNGLFPFPGTSCVSCGQPLTVTFRYCERCGEAQQPTFSSLQVAMLTAGALSVLFVFLAVGAETWNRAESVTGFAGTPNTSGGAQLKASRKNYPTKVDVPALIFRPRSEVEAILGKPNKVLRDRTLMNWSEGTIQVAFYRSGTEAHYLNGRLFELKYVFENGKSPTDAGSALESAGFRASEVSGDRHEELGYFTRNIPFNNNPIIFRGLKFYDVTVSSKGTYFHAVAINLNRHYDDWDSTMRNAWIRSGMEPLSSGRDARVCLGPIPPNGDILKAPFVTCQ